jgi:uncharacterized phage infection (PIP) family protein YhgE
MRQQLNWQQQLQRVIAIATMMLLLVLAPSFTSSAQAEETGFFTAAQTFLKTVNDARSTYGGFSQEAQKFLNQDTNDLRQTLRTLADDLQRLTTEKDASSRDALRREIVEKQESLGSFAKGFDEWFGKADRADKTYESALSEARSTLEKALDRSEAELKQQARSQTADFKQGLKATANAFSALIEDTNRIANGKAAFVPDQFEQQLKTLNQAYEGVNGVIQAFAR